MQIVLTTFDRVQLSYAETLLKEAGIEAAVLDASQSCYDTLNWQASQLMVLSDEDGEAARAILRDGLKNFPSPESAS